MFHLRRWVVLSLLVLFPLGGAMAAPAKGFSVFGGVANSSSSGEFTSGAANGANFSMSGSGLGFGFDYQLPVAEHVSINFLLEGSSENASSSQLKIDNISHSIFAVEARYWFGDEYFAGVHAGSYTETVSSTSGNTTSSSEGSGTGYGLSVGWAKPDSGLFLMGQYDKASIDYSDAHSNMTGLRLNIGYRWGR